jgi:hypothetical protein
MPASFDREGVSFAYPENWELDESPLDEGWSVAVQSPSPNTAFMVLSVHTERPTVQSVLDTALATLREDYADLESDPAEEEIAGRHARGLDVQFFSLDLVNNCWIRSFRTKTETILILCQASDLEFAAAEPVLRAMRASLRVGEG